MKHVVTAAPTRQCVLVTGFGPFPGARTNPSASILGQLRRHGARLQRLGIALRCVLLPVVHDEIGPSLARAVAVHRPDAILHLGLAGRRSKLSVETRAVNRVGPLHPDARGRLPPSQVLARGAPPSLTATYEAARVLAAIRRQGLAASRSIDAGDYVCNTTLYRSLLAVAAPRIGFLHVPRVQRPDQPKARTRNGKPTTEALTRAVMAALLVMGR
jgi:pyroglutamyl-peptidase